MFLKIKFNKNKFTKSVLIYTASTFCNSVTPFLLLPFLTRYLQPSEYGVISMFNICISFFSPFVCMGATSAISRKIINKRSENRVYVFNCIFISFILEILLSLLIFYYHKNISKIIGIPSVLFIDIVILIYSTVIVDITLVILQMYEKIKSFAIFQNTSTLLNLVLSLFLIIKLNMGLQGRIYGIVFSKFIFAIIGLVIIKKEIGLEFKIKKSYIKDSVLNYGLPLIPTSLKVTVLTFIDRLFITHMISIYETGIYSVGNQFSLPILLLAQSFNLAYVPWLYKKLKNNNNDKDKLKIVKLTYIYFIVIFIIAVLWSFVSYPIIKFISGKNYYDAIDYILWLSIGYSFTAMHMMVVNYIYFYKKVRLYSIVTIIVIFSNIILNYIFIKIFGTIGAAQATMIANFISFILTWLLVSRICDMPWFYILKK